MSLCTVAHYLAIEWHAPGKARRVEASAGPIRIERGEDGVPELELQIFPEDHAWLGLRAGQDQAALPPIWTAPDGKAYPFVSVNDERGAIWWVPALEWDSQGKRHLNAFYRSLGDFEIAIGEESLRVRTISHDGGRLQLEDYLSDFQNDLIWLALGNDGVGARAITPREEGGLVTALREFSDALARVERHPATEIRESIGETSRNKLRPSGATFRRHSRDPNAPRLPSRLAVETADLPDNRFLRHMTEHCMKLARRVAVATQRRAEILLLRARQEIERGEEYGRIEFQVVDPDIFDRQLDNLERQLDEIRSWSGDDFENLQVSILKFPIKVTSRYGRKEQEFFYDRLPSSDNQLRIDNNANEEKPQYSVVCLPAKLAKLVFSMLHVSKDYAFYAPRKHVASTIKFSEMRKPYRRLDLKQVNKVEPYTNAVEIKREKRIRLERDGWRVTLTPKEKAEYEQAAAVARKRGETLERVSEDADASATSLREIANQLRARDIGLQALGIGRSATMPTNMRFSMHTNYVACLNAFSQVRAHAKGPGLDLQALDAIERVGTLHASALYERWCLIKILLILISEYGFQPPMDWQEQVVAGVTSVPEPFALGLFRRELGLGALFESQPRLKNGRRPDFRLRFAYLPESLTSLEVGGIPGSYVEAFKDCAGLIMDAKFRTRWRPGELEQMLATLIVQKCYGIEGDRVFILHPVASSILAPTSPLDWGSHCDYGQEHSGNHRCGTVWLSPNAGEGDAQRHLRRLIGLELQATFKTPFGADRNGIDGDKIWASRSFCIACGKAHDPGDIVAKRTRKEFPYWKIGCSDCGMVTTRTHCYGSECGTPLFKNHFRVTYHATIADQPTNIICPNCGSFFDNDWVRGNPRDE